MQLTLGICIVLALTASKIQSFLLYLQSSWEDQDTHKVYSCVDLYFVCQVNELVVLFFLYMTFNLENHNLEDYTHFANYLFEFGFRTALLLRRSTSSDHIFMRLRRYVKCGKV